LNQSPSCFLSFILLGLGFFGTSWASGFFGSRNRRVHLFPFFLLEDRYPGSMKRLEHIFFVFFLFFFLPNFEMDGGFISYSFIGKDFCAAVQTSRTAPSAHVPFKLDLC